MNSSTTAASIRYCVEVKNFNAHLFNITLVIQKPSAKQVLSLPVWIPGSYLVREFSKCLQGFSARQGGKAVGVQQLDKCTWQLDCQGKLPVTVSYEVYALDNSVRTAWLDARRGFFNGTSLFLKVRGHEGVAHQLELPQPVGMEHWQLATGLTPQKINKRGFGSYRASHYDELVDCPVEMGDFWSAEFTACGVPHRFVVAGAPPGFDGERLLADTRRICETEIRFWSPTKGRTLPKAPHRNYLFMLNAVDDGYGGLEHRNSTALICNRKDLPRLSHPAQPSQPLAADSKPRQSDGYTTLLGLISHEYFHTWNVKRLRPAEFSHYQYDHENYTELLWFFEGFTSYYDDLLLRRAGLLDDASYLKLLNKTINQVMQTPGRLVQSVAQASFDAWVKYYRPDENTANATVSYYTKGALVALCLDLTLRQAGKTSLDAVMRALWQRCKAGPMSQDDLAAVLQELSGRSFHKELARWVHGTSELPVKDLLQAQGVVVLEEPAQLAQRLGLRVSETSGVQIKTVLRDGAAEQAGFAPGDEWLGVEVGSGKSASAWRLSKLDDLLQYAGSARQVQALVARDKRLLWLALTLPKASTTWRLVARDTKLVTQWLSGV